MSTDILHDAHLIERHTELIQQIDPMFAVLESRSPIRSDLVRLAAGTLAAVRIPEQLPRARCADLARVLNSYQFDNYDERRIYPPVMKLGPALFDYYLDGKIREDYWQHAEQSRASWTDIVGSDDPLETVIDTLRETWNGPVRPATVGGRPLFTGLVRELTGGARMHFDEVMREFPGTLDQDLIAQFGFNCYISVPDQGGDLVVYRRRWKPSDEQFRLGYGWSEEIAWAEPRAVIKPDLGDSVYFDCRNYHSITKNVSGYRRSLSFFCGITADNELVLWS